MSRFISCENTLMCDVFICNMEHTWSQFDEKFSQLFYMTFPDGIVCV